MAPINPINTPVTLYHLLLILKKINPRSNVNRGVSEFNIPASELLIPVWAMANKNEGIRLPIIPEIIRYFLCLLFILLNLINAKGSKKRNVMLILNTPTSMASK